MRWDFGRPRDFCFHESGHAVAAQACGLRVYSVTVLRGDNGGGIEHADGPGHVAPWWTAGRKAAPTAAERASCPAWKADLVVGVAGRMAEGLDKGGEGLRFSPRVPAPLSRGLRESWPGLRTRPARKGERTDPDEVQVAACVLALSRCGEGEPLALVREAERVACRLLVGRWEAVRRLAKAVAVRGCMDADAVGLVLGEKALRADDDLSAWIGWRRRK